MSKVFSIVVPVYQNAENLPVSLPVYIDFARSLSGYETEIVCVDDGSTDRSLEILLGFQREHPDLVRVVKLTRNFGQYNALMAGLSVARGDVIGQLTADMQDPVELFGDMLKEWEAGHKIVVGERVRRHDRWMTKSLSRLFNRAVRSAIDPRFPKEGFDFFILDREVADQALDLAEKNTSLQLVMLWLGYGFTSVPYERRRRTVGKSTWTFWKKVKRAIDVFVTNSYKPIRAVSTMGFLFAAAAFAYIGYRVIRWMITGSSGPVQGWTSLAILIMFFSGLLLVALGIVGEYLWRIFDNTKSRPLFVVDRVFERDVDAG